MMNDGRRTAGETRLTCRMELYGLFSESQNGYGQKSYEIDDICYARISVKLAVLERRFALCCARILR